MLLECVTVRKLLGSGVTVVSSAIPSAPLSLPAAKNERRSKKANRVPKRAPCNAFTRIQEVVDLAYVEHKLKET